MKRTKSWLDILKTLPALKLVFLKSQRQKTSPVASQQSFVYHQTVTHPQMIHQETHKPTSMHILSHTLHQIAPRHPPVPLPNPSSLPKGNHLQYHLTSIHPRHLLPWTLKGRKKTHLFKKAPLIKWGFKVSSALVSHYLEFNLTQWNFLFICMHFLPGCKFHKEKSCVTFYWVFGFSNQLAYR